MPILRTPPSAALETRDGHIDKDVLLSNGYVETDATGNQTVTKRPGLDSRTAALGAGNAMYLYGDRLYIWNATEPHGLLPRDISYVNGKIYCTFNTGTTASAGSLYPNDFTFVYRGNTSLKLTQVFQEMTPTDIPALNIIGTRIHEAPDGSLFSLGKINGAGHSADGDDVFFRSTTNGASWTYTPYTTQFYALYSNIVDGELVGHKYSGFYVSLDNGNTETLRSTIEPAYTGKSLGALGLAYGPTGTIVANLGIPRVTVDGGFTWNVITFPTGFIPGGSADAPDTVFKGGKFFSFGKFKYAESVDGVSWTDLGNLPVGLLGGEIGNYRLIPDLSGSPVQDFEVRLGDGFRYIYRFFPDNTWEVIGDIELYINGLYPSFTSTSPQVEYSIVKINDVYMFLEVVEDAPYLFYSYDGLVYRSLKLERDYFDGFPINIGGV